MRKTTGEVIRLVNGALANLIINKENDRFSRLMEKLLSFSLLSALVPGLGTSSADLT